MPREITINSVKIKIDDWSEVIGKESLKVAYAVLYRWHKNYIDCANDIVNGGYIGIIEDKNVPEFEDEWAAAKYVVRLGVKAFTKNYRNNRKVSVSINDTLTEDGFTLENILSDATDIESDLFASDTKLDLMSLVSQTGDEDLITLTHLLLNGLTPLEIAEDMKITTLTVMRMHRALTDLAITHNIGSATPKLKLAQSSPPKLITKSTARNQTMKKMIAKKSYRKTKFEKQQGVYVKLLTVKRGGTVGTTTYRKNKFLTLKWGDANKLLEGGYAVKIPEGTEILKEWRI